ncbi:hypothetical protein BST83_01120 [Polaribacter filamentus]|uniref:Altered inheritance of mitochondria protein 6 n=1 Tax=Polaribacter filamentus TaxID=53483 RepID=A0A2S7L2P0_9FLAO|nr:hypothetical protein [Polaribacter filamentus]PQB08983.1 hypothetical protein BST83_01120 [Polaribacter filamentus]
MNKIFKILSFFFLILISCSKNDTHIIIQGHAHNDYEHKRSLFDALENGFISVEADVHLINNQLYVSHFKPSVIDSTKTLENLYLKPLSNIVSKNNGSVYKNYDGFFYLMIDVKTEADSSYVILKNILNKYEEIISKVNNEQKETNKPIKIVITGHKGRPYNQILEEKSTLMSIDGRFKELDKNISYELMPYISENYKHYFSYKGDGEPSSKDIKTVSEMVSKTHQEGKKLRFWASPDKEKVWRFLLDNKVDLVNVDSLQKFNKYITKRKNDNLK